MSAKKKYKFNPITLMYELEIVSFASRVRRLLLLFTGISVIAAAWIFTYSFCFSTPKEISIRKITQSLLFEYEIITAKLAEKEELLNTIMERDNKVYRAVFEEDTIPYTIRNAGFGGSDRYVKFDDLGIEHSYLLKKTYRTMDILYKKAYIQSKSFDKVGELAANKILMQQSMPISAPLDLDPGKVRFSSAFGFRTDPVFGYLRMHEGIDLSGNVGLPIYATGNGVVIRSEFSGAFGYGFLVEIDHGFGYSTRYAHLSKLNVAAGAKIKRGDKVGELGNTGKSVGPHLHYEVRLRGIPQNPLNYFKNTLDENTEELQFVDQGDNVGDEEK